MLTNNYEDGYSDGVAGRVDQYAEGYHRAKLRDRNEGWLVVLLGAIVFGVLGAWTIIQMAGELPV